MEKHFFSIDALSTSEVGDLEFRQALGVEALVIISFEANRQVSIEPQLADLPRLSKTAQEN